MGLETLSTPEISHHDKFLIEAEVLKLYNFTTKASSNEQVDWVQENGQKMSEIIQYSDLTPELFELARQENYQEAARLVKEELDRQETQ